MLRPLRESVGHIKGEVNREGAMALAKASVLARIAEYDTIGKKEFLKKYASGRGAKNYYILYNNELYDLKAIYAAAVAQKPKDKTSRDSKKELDKLGFECITGSQDSKKYYSEGEKRWTEVQVVTRNKSLVSEAKELYKPVCRACGFDFNAFYGPIGTGFIECHHLYPISQVGKKPPPVTVEDVTVLCANCHRMVHHNRGGDDPLTVDQLKAHIAAARNSN